MAHALAASRNVTVVELGGPVSSMQARIRDVGHPARLDPHVGAGLGGTTALWHNGLIEVDEDVFARRWPVPRAEIEPWYEAAYPLLSGTTRAAVVEAGSVLRRLHERAGLHVDGAPQMFVPTHRRNLWRSLALEGRVRVVTADAVRLEMDGASRVRCVVVRESGREARIASEQFVLAAGGLGTPPLLQTLGAGAGLSSLRNAGRYYEDHPMACVGVLKLRAPLYRFWNYAAAGTGGTIRLPLVVRHRGIHVGFQLRPASLLQREARKNRLGSVITQLRNDPLNPIHYFRLLARPDDILDILSFRFGIRVPTRLYSLLMVAEQPPSEGRAVWAEGDPALGTTVIHRKWEVSPGYLATLQEAIGRFVEGLGDLVLDARLFPDWSSTVQTAAHHSGTARMSASPEQGVCDSDGRVHGLENLYVADGSLIPGSGIANTGLTIAALALRTAHRLCTNGRSR